MFSDFMSSFKFSRTVNKIKKDAKNNPYSGYSSIISSCLESEAKGVFKNWPDTMKRQVNELYQFAIAEYEKTDVVQEQMRIHKQTEINTITLILGAVLVQAVACKDISVDDTLQDLDEIDNLCKKLVNLKLVPERFLDDEVELTTVA